MIDEIQTTFLKSHEFNEVKGRLKFDDPSILNEFHPSETDIIAIDFTINSPPVIKNLETIPKGDFASFWSGRFKKEGVSKEELKKAFSIDED